MNTEKIIAVLEAEQELITGMMAILGTEPIIKRCGHTGRCAVGALLAATGVSDQSLADWGLSKSGNSFEDFDAILLEAYDMDSNQSWELMMFNDDRCETDDAGNMVFGKSEGRARTERVIEYIRTL